MKLSDLKPNMANPRKCDDAALKRLRNTLAKHGDLGGIVFNRTTKQLIGGHQRGKVLPQDAEIQIIKEYKKPTKTGTVAMGYVDIDGELHSYREVEVDADTEKAMNVAANKGAGEWDKALLAEWLLELDAKGWEIEDTGFSKEEFEDLCAPWKEDKEGLCDDDEVPDVATDEAKCKTGELWLLGEHRLLVGDCTVKENVDRLMAGEKADMVFTDPPYGISLDTDYASTKPKDSKPEQFTRPINSFKAIESDGEAFDSAHIISMFEKTKEIFIFGANNFCHTIPKYQEGSWVCWDRTGGAENLDEMLGSSFELCWSKQRHKYQIARVTWKGVFGHSKQDDGEKKVHPSMKPVSLMEWFFSRWGKGLNLVWDGYLGSGSTLIACEKTNRRCFGMEIDPHYCDVIIQRFQKYSGKKAIREDGTAFDSL